MKVFGTKFEIDSIIVIKKSDFGELKIGVVKSIAFHEEQVHFVCKIFLASQSKYGYYITTSIFNELELVSLSELADHHPLKKVGLAEKFCFSLHHYIMQV